MPLELQTITQPEAFAFIEEWHRHHHPPQGWRWGLAANDGERVVGVLVVGRPVARGFDPDQVAEVTRLCTIPRDQGGPKNAGTILLGAAARSIRDHGFKAGLSYILADEETGVTYKAAAWWEGWRVPGRSWSCETRPRDDKHPTGDKLAMLSPFSVDPRGLAARPRVALPHQSSIVQPGLWDGLVG